MRAILSFMVVVCSVVAVSKGVFAQDEAIVARYKSIFLNEINANLDSQRSLPPKPYFKFGPFETDAKNQALAASLLTADDFTKIINNLNIALDLQLGNRAQKNFSKLSNILGILQTAITFDLEGKWSQAHTDGILSAQEKIVAAKSINKTVVKPELLKKISAILAEASSDAGNLRLGEINIPQGMPKELQDALYSKQQAHRSTLTTSSGEPLEFTLEMMTLSEMSPFDCAILLGIKSVDENQK